MFRSAIAAIAAGTLVAGCSAAPKPADEPRPVAVELAVAAPAVPAAIYRGPGSVRAQHTYRLAFQVAGRVRSVGADVGDRVSAGATLASLDTDDYQAQLDAATARAAQARAQAARAQNGARPQERMQADQAAIAAGATVARARAALELAQANDRRMQTLVVSGDVAQQQADTTHAALRDAQALYDGARAQLDSARANASLVGAGTRNEDRAAADAGAAAADADVALAQATLAKTRLTAPADAYVLARDVEAGDAAQPGALAFTLTSAETPEVAVDVPERLADDVRPGTTATVVSGPRTFRARVSRIEPAADATTRTLEVRLQAPGLALAPGAVVNVTLGARRSAGASVPYGALVQAGGATYVAKYDEANASIRRIAVTVVSADGQRADVTGIHPGDRVVTMGQREALPGKPVRVVASAS